MRARVGCEDEADAFVPGEHRMDDTLGLGRIASLWWTENFKYNAAYELHRLNVGAELGREAVESFDDTMRDVRFDFVKSARGLACYMHALRAELAMRLVMPALLPHSKEQPYLCMARVEWGSNRNPHTHGFCV